MTSSWRSRRGIFSGGGLTITELSLMALGFLDILWLLSVKCSLKEKKYNLFDKTFERILEDSGVAKNKLNSDENKLMSKKFE